ncbi:MAG: DUF523 domain-containing protein [Planctomycetes bacterium]|nr:DUF523 domain-containing protein [Planctomycetota bacterium]
MANPSDSETNDRSESTPVLVSACLLGRPCRYDGKAKRDASLEQELQSAGLRPIPFCPEESGGLSTPRPKAWIESQDAAAVWSGDSEMVTEHGQNVSKEFKAGAALAMEQCVKHSISDAYLKERSPSCGVEQTHVQNKPVAGPGVTTALLIKNGVRVHGR